MSKLTFLYPRITFDQSPSIISELSVVLGHWLMLTQFLKQSVKEVQLPAPQIGLRENVKNSSSSSTGDGLKKSLVLELTLTCFTVYDEYGCNLSAKCCTRAGELPLSGCRHSQVAYSLNFKMGPNQVKMEIFHSQIIPSASLSN